jgi:hypothetical protein
MSVKFLAQGNNDLPLTGFELMRIAINILLGRSVYHSAMPPDRLVDNPEVFVTVLECIVLKSCTALPYFMDDYIDFRKEICKQTFSK